MKSLIFFSIIVCLASCTGGRIIVIGGTYPSTPPVVWSTDDCGCVEVVGRTCFFYTTIDRFTPRAGGKASFQRCGEQSFADLSAEDLQYLNAGYNLRVKAYRFL